MAIPAPWMMALNANTPTTTPQPCTLLCTPPATMTTKLTSVHSSTTTPKLIRNPTVRHMLQKEASLSQSVVRGKGTQCPVFAEQREWRP